MTTVTQSSNNKNWKIFYTLTGLVGLILAVFIVQLYRLTLINYIIPLIIVIVVGLVVGFFNRNHYHEIYPNYSSFYSYLQNVFSWGFIVAYAFLAINYYCINSNPIGYKFKIESKDSMPGPKNHRSERQPLVHINYNGFDKELVFEYEQTYKVNKADSVIVYAQKGALGFDILARYDLVDKL
jgi:predicted membrane protein